MQVLPLFLSLESRDCLVACADSRGLAKVRLIARAGGRVICAARQERVSRSDALAAGASEHIELAQAETRLPERGLVILSGLDDAHTEVLAKGARQRGNLVNVVDRPAMSDVVFGGIIDRAPMKIGVFSGGSAPAAARAVRERIEALLPENLGPTIKRAEPVRNRLLQTKSPPETRARVWVRFWKDFFRGTARRLPDADDPTAIQTFVAAMTQPEKGRLIMINAPDAPDRLTLRQARVLFEADEILASETDLERFTGLFRRDAILRPDSDVDFPTLLNTLETGRQVVWLRRKNALCLPARFIDEARRRSVPVLMPEDD